MVVGVEISLIVVCGDESSGGEVQGELSNVGEVIIVGEGVDIGNDVDGEEERVESDVVSFLHVFFFFGES